MSIKMGVLGTIGVVALCGLTAANSGTTFTDSAAPAAPDGKRIMAPGEMDIGRLDGVLWGDILHVDDDMETLHVDGGEVVIDEDSEYVGGGDADFRFPGEDPDGEFDPQGFVDIEDAVWSRRGVFLDLWAGDQGGDGQGNTVFYNGRTVDTRPGSQPAVSYDGEYAAWFDASDTAAYALEVVHLASGRRVMRTADGLEEDYTNCADETCPQIADFNGKTIRWWDYGTPKLTTVDDGRTVEVDPDEAEGWPRGRPF